MLQFPLCNWNHVLEYSKTDTRSILIESRKSSRELDHNSFCIEISTSYAPSSLLWIFFDHNFVFIYIIITLSNLEVFPASDMRCTSRNYKEQFIKVSACLDGGKVLRCIYHHSSNKKEKPWTYVFVNCLHYQLEIFSNVYLKEEEIDLIIYFMARS